MGKHPIHGGDTEVLRRYSLRRLKGGLEVLKNLCRDASQVLDVGCGPGSITIDVAKLVSGGSVTGIDREQTAIERANDLAGQNKATNVRFLVGSVHALPFAEGFFDVTYANALLEWMEDPVQAVSEMMRVTKPGGAVVARNNDYGTAVMFPNVPHIEKWLHALGYFRDQEGKPEHGSRWLGRELFSLFTRAGLEEVIVSAEAPEVRWYGHESFEDMYKAWRLHLDPKASMSVFARTLVAAGVITDADLKSARSELETWHENPEAFVAGAMWFTAVGRVPEDQVGST
jgi:ubiquinone/menaquinone biosynthesis C-methylase UbiE